MVPEFEQEEMVFGPSKNLSMHQLDNEHSTSKSSLSTSTNKSLYLT